MERKENRSENVKKGLLIAAGVTAAAGVCALLSFSLTNFLLKEALDRKEPAVIKKAKKKIAGEAVGREILEQASAAAEELKQKCEETVQITAGYDGITLVGHWYPAEKPERVIVAMHGWRSSWNFDFGIISTFLHEKNCSLLLVEQRGQSDSASGGDYMGFGMIERFDALDWVNYAISEKAGDLPVYLAGVSMGAATVLMASGLTLPPQVHGIMADCGYTSAHMIWKHVMQNNLHLLYGLRGDLVAEICRRKIQMNPRDCTTTDALRKNLTPVLFIHGTDDHFVPISMTYDNYKACAAPKRLLVVPGAEHGMSYTVDRERYQAAMVKFWRDFDAYEVPQPQAE